jgi:spore germination protein GerM
MKKRGARKKAAGDIRRYVLLAFLAIAVAVLAVVFFRGGGQEQIKTGAGEPAAGPPRAAAPPSESRIVTLFLTSEDDSLLHPEERRIPAGPSTVEEASSVVRELIRGSNKGLLSALPSETRLRRLFITKEGIAYVDFSKEIVDHLAGSSEELAAVYSVVNSLAYNFKSIKKVFILVEGAEKETLGGHINLGEAFVPQYSLDAQ